MQVTTAGNVGVGTTTASAKLEVVGNKPISSSAWVTQTSPYNNSWTSVTYGNGLFVAVACGYNATTCNATAGNRVMTSPDGISWTARTSAANNQWTSVTYGNGLFVAVSNTGTGNRVMTSPDGITWTIRTSAVNNSWTSVTYGNGLFVAVACGYNATTCNATAGNRVMTSPDGISWTARTSAANNQWTSVTYGNGLFVAVSNTGTGNRVMTSPDGINWTSRVTPASAPNLKSVTYGNGRFIAVEYNNADDHILTSIDGLNWVERPNPNKDLAINYYQSVTYGDGLFVMVGKNGTVGEIMTSYDGENWTKLDSPNTTNWSSVIYGNGNFVAVGPGGTQGSVMTSSAPSQLKVESADTMVWNMQDSPISPVTAFGGGVYVSLLNYSGSTYSMVSRDRINFTGSSTPLSPQFYNYWKSITYGNGLFVAVACGVAIDNSCNATAGNRVMTSPDGITWTSRTTPADNYWNSVTYGNGLFVAVASSGTGNRVMTSPDGITWTARTSAADNGWKSVTYGNGLFVAVASTGTGNRIMTSPDGITWAIRADGSDMEAVWYNVIYAKNEFMAFGIGCQTPYFGISPCVMVSTPQSLALKVVGDTRFSSSVDSSTSLTVSNSQGQNVLAVDTLNNQLVLSSSVLTATAQGYEIFGTDNYSCTGTNWVRTATNTYTHTPGSAASLVCTSPTLLPSQAYVIDYTITGSTSGEYHIISLGNPRTGSLFGDTADALAYIMTDNSTYKFGVHISTSANQTGSIKINSMRPYTKNTAALAIKDYTGNVSAELRVMGDSIALGMDSLKYNSLDNFGYGGLLGNTAIGYRSLQANTEGFENTANGAYSLQNNASGYSNTASGYQSLQSNTTGFSNSAYGRGSLLRNTTGSENSALGQGSLEYNTTGSGNTASGAYSLQSNSTGNNNTASGVGSLCSNSIGSNNTALGYYAGCTSSREWGFYSLNNLQNTTMIGAYSQAYANNVLALGGQGADSVKVGIGTGLPTNQLSAESYRYSTGTVTTNGTTTVTGTGTTFTADMVGNVIYIATNSTTTAPYMRTITGFTSATQITVDSSVPALTDTQYYINYVGLQVTTGGRVGIGTLAPTTELEVVGDITSIGTKWTSRTSAADNSWNSVTYGNGLFVAVSIDGANRVMTSPDGINWTSRTSPSNSWTSITYGNGLFVAVSIDGANRVMTSPDGINWTSRTSPNNSWTSITYGNGLFVASANQSPFMTSPDGINWTTRLLPTDYNDFNSVTYGNGLFVAVSYNCTDTCIATSPDGITWTYRGKPLVGLMSVTYGNGLFVAIPEDNSANLIVTSPDGINWTTRAIPYVEDDILTSVNYGNGLFVVIGYSFNGTGNRVMTSPDGINWTSRTSAADNSWQSVTYGNGLFVAVAWSGTGNRAMTSGKQDLLAVSNNNTYQGGIKVYGTNNQFISDANSTTAFSVQNNSGTSVLNVDTTNNRVGIANTAPGYLLHVGSSTITTGTSVARFENAGGTCTITPSTAGGITCTSDVRFKKNTENVNSTDVLNKLLGLNTIAYNMNAESDTDLKHVGFSAQQLETIMPDLVVTDSEGYKSVSYSGLTPYLVAGVQAQQDQLQNLKNDVSALQTAVSGTMLSGQDLTIANLNVSGATNLTNLVVSGDATINGKLSVQTIVVANLEVSGHISTSGTVPTGVLGAAAGVAYTSVTPSVDVQGNDTAGTITIVTGTSTSSGEIIEVSFAEPFSKAPKVMLTAGNEPAATLQVYCNPQAGKFSIKLAQPPAPGQTYVLYYFVIE